EHFLFPALVEHGCTLTNMRGLYSDVIAEHVFGLMLSFTRHLHTYVRNQAAARWEPAGGEQSRPTFTTGPGTLSAMDLAHRSLGDLTLGIVGLGSIGLQIARTGAFFGMRVVAVDAVARPAPEGVAALWPADRLSELLGTSDFVVIAAPHTPE